MINLEKEERRRDVCLFTILLSPAAFSLLSSLMPEQKSLLAVAWAFLSIPALTLLWGYLERCLRYRQGLKGERVVGEMLTELLSCGYCVYHDLQMEKGGNIDHIVVGPSGFYAIETKCSSKQKSIQGRKEHFIQFTGSSLIYPHTENSFGINQAKRNAAWLSRFPSSAIGERVHVNGMLVFPGWWIESKIKMSKEFRVLNHKNAAKCILGDSQNTLNEKQIRQMNHQLERECRSELI